MEKTMCFTEEMKATAVAKFAQSALCRALDNYVELSAAGADEDGDDMQTLNTIISMLHNEITDRVYQSALLDMTGNPSNYLRYLVHTTEVTTIQAKWRMKYSTPAKDIFAQSFGMAASRASRELANQTYRHYGEGVDNITNAVTAQSDARIQHLRDESVNAMSREPSIVAIGGLVGKISFLNGRDHDPRLGNAKVESATMVSNMTTHSGKYLKAGLNTHCYTTPRCVAHQDLGTEAIYTAAFENIAMLHNLANVFISDLTTEMTCLKIEDPVAFASAPPHIHNAAGIVYMAVSRYVTQVLAQLAFNGTRTVVSFIDAHCYDPKAAQQDLEDGAKQVRRKDADGNTVKVTSTRCSNPQAAANTLKDFYPQLTDTPLGDLPAAQVFTMTLFKSDNATYSSEEGRTPFTEFNAADAEPLTQDTLTMLWNATMFGGAHIGDVHHYVATYYNNIETMGGVIPVAEADAAKIRH